jgi:hypothetical protein
MCVAIHYVKGQKRLFGCLLESWNERTEAYFCSYVSNGIHLKISVLLSILLSSVIFLSQHIGSVRVATLLLGASNGKL